jgi:hypothetical protein
MAGVNRGGVANSGSDAFGKFQGGWVFFWEGE